MKQFLGRTCKLVVDRDGRLLYYTAKLVTDISSEHITFIDRYGEYYTYRSKDVVEISGF